MGKKSELVMLFYLARLFVRSKRGQRINLSLILGLSGRYRSALPEHRACYVSALCCRLAQTKARARALVDGGATGCGHDLVPDWRALQGQAIATVFGDQKTGLARIGFNFLTQAINMGFQRVGRDASIIAPYLMQKNVSWHYIFG